MSLLRPPLSIVLERRFEVLLCDIFDPLCIPLRFF
jgi:hypothetical protein